MTRLPQIGLQFNRKLKLSNEGDELSSDAGQLLFREFDDKIGFSKTTFEHLQLNDEQTFMFTQIKAYFAKRFTN